MSAALFETGRRGEEEEEGEEEGEGGHLLARHIQRWPSTAHQLKQPGRRDQLPAPHHQLLRHKPCARSRCVVSPISRAFSRVFLAFPLDDSASWSCDRLVSADTWWHRKTIIASSSSEFDDSPAVIRPQAVIHNPKVCSLSVVIFSPMGRKTVMVGDALPASEFPN